jgi:hypothetical protein
VSPELTVALVAAGASIVVAVISLVTAIMSSRQSARSERAIESLKFEFQRATAQETLRDQHLAQCVEALQTFVSLIQRIKDEMQIILSAAHSGGTMRSRTAHERVSAARQTLFSAYEDNLSCLDEDEARICHRAKNLSLTIETSLVEILNGKRYVSLSLDEQSRFTALRNELTELQQVLRDSRADRLMRRLAGD